MNRGYTKFIIFFQKRSQRTSKLDLCFLYQSLLFQMPHISIKMLLNKNRILRYLWWLGSRCDNCNYLQQRHHCSSFYFLLYFSCIFSVSQVRKPTPLGSCSSGSGKGHKLAAIRRHTTPCSAGERHMLGSARGVSGRGHSGPLESHGVDLSSLSMLEGGGEVPTTMAGHTKASTWPGAALNSLLPRRSNPVYLG